MVFILLYFSGIFINRIYTVEVIMATIEEREFLSVMVAKVIARECRVNDWNRFMHIGQAVVLAFEKYAKAIEQPHAQICPDDLIN